MKKIPMKKEISQGKRKFTDQWSHTRKFLPKQLYTLSLCMNTHFINEFFRTLALYDAENHLLQTHTYTKKRNRRKPRERRGSTFSVYRKLVSQEGWLQL